jgi:RNA polymerase sigma-70 factor (ECF subfamily)
MPASTDKRSYVEAILPTERAHLVQLCTQITGAADVADDLAQEVMVIAWQHAGQLRDPARCRQWIAGIARNLSLRWLRDQKRQPLHLIAQDDEDALDAVVGATGQFDLNVELDRQELAHLLDRALALLPPLTRTVLVERYIYESPQAEVARQLGLSEGAVEARVQRGKLTLRRVLATDLRDEATAYGLMRPDDGWQETRIWCPCCGRQRLNGRLELGNRSLLHLWCACGANTGVTDIPGLFEGIHGFRAALSRVAHWHHTLFQHGIKDGHIPCPHCHAAVRLHITPSADMPSTFAPLLPMPLDTYGVWAFCSQCRHWGRQADLFALAMHFPEVRRFWREHPRMFALPLRPLADVAGAPALLVTFQDITSRAQIDLIFAQSTLTRITP